jgi:HD domain
MKRIHERIYEDAKPYLNTRRNDVHTAMSYAFACRLLACHPEADEDVVVPAIILHDVGWKAVPEDKQLSAFGPNLKDNETRRLHEVEGVRIAKGILVSLDYSEEKRRQILAIIDGHDTRHEALSLNDSLVKDADKLWRYTPTGIDIDHLRFGIDRRDYLNWISGTIDKWLFTPDARVMAHEALDESNAQGGTDERL